VAGCENTTIALMVEFLAYTGVRVSEMLNILLSDIKARRDRVDVRVIGKGGKERIVWVDKPLLERIRNHFSESKWLFEHTGKQYSRVAVTNRIKYWGVKVLGREITAHTLRHSFATHKLRQTRNLKGVSKYLGYATTSVTADLYVHEELAWEDIEGGLEGPGGNVSR